MENVTYQHFDARVFTGPMAIQAGGAFVAAAFAQCPVQFIMNVVPDGVTVSVTVSMDDWPDDEQFGPWFDELMVAMCITVED